jgi:AcrR family transcriptional regulator
MAGAERREQLLDVCARLVDVDGFAAATLDRVANEAGVTRTVVYQHFGGLDGLFDAVIGRAATRAGEALAAGAGPDVTPVEAMARVLDAADADPATWRLFLVIPPAGPQALTDALERGRAAIRRHVVAGIDGREGGSTDPELAARLLQVTSDELVRLRLADPAMFTHERLLDQFREVAGLLLGTGADKG